MTKQKMSREELNKESLRLSALIAEGSKAGLKAVAEMAKHPLTLDQMREQVRRQQQRDAKGWIPTSIPSSEKRAS